MIVEHEFTLRSLSPLLMNNPVGMRGAARGGKVEMKTIPTPEDEAEAKAYRLPDGRLYLSSDMVRQSLVTGCLGRRLGKTSAATMVKAGVMPIDEQVPLLDPETLEPLTAYVIDTRRVVVQKQGVLRSRAKVPQWLLRIRFACDSDFITPKHVETLFDYAGRIAGLGDYRPKVGGTFGRYAVVPSS